MRRGLHMPIVTRLMERSVPRNTESLAVLVDFVRDFLEAEHLSKDLAFDLDLVIEELFTNLVRHGRAEGDILVRLERTPGEVHVRLRAAEPSPFDPTSVPPVNVDLPIEDRRPGGLGIHLVRKMCRQFRYEWHDGVGTTLAVVGVSDSCSS